jgi:hypothetical protein
MRVEKAIELLEQDYDDPGSDDYTDLMEAQALSIEALKRVQVQREIWGMGHDALLPGETKD